MVPASTRENIMAKRRKKSQRKSPSRGGVSSTVGNLASMTVDALIKMRDDIGKILSDKAEQLQSQLAALGEHSGTGRRQKGRVGSLKGRKVAPKYRNPKNRAETWAGRGAMPRWMATEIKAGKKREDFLINKGK
jgi:DNA-binding protein H-NS